MTRNSIKGTLANSEDPDEMMHHAAFHQGLHCVLRQNKSSEKELYIFFFEIITCNHSLCTMDRPDLTISNLMENSINGTLANSEDPIMRHFIRVCTVCLNKINLQRKKYFFLKL